MHGRKNINVLVTVDKQLYTYCWLFTLFLLDPRTRKSTYL